MVKEIPLTKNQVTLVDDLDFEYLNQWKWRAFKPRNTFYAVREQHIGTVEGKRIRKGIYMHRLIMNPNSTELIDHIDGNGLNNQRKNLRIVTPRQNSQNRANFISRSKYVGVTWDTQKNKWKAHIQIKGKYNHIGYFADEKEAGNAYKNAVHELVGEKLVCELEEEY